MIERKLSELNKKQMFWLDNPLKYDYLRESSYMACSVNAKPMRKGAMCWFDGREGGWRGTGKEIKKKGLMKLVGYEKLIWNASRVMCGVYYWLKPYDKGMPDEKLCYGHPDCPEYIRPSEAVTIILDEIEDGLPIIRAKKDGNQYSFWCGFCHKIHYHGVPEGHRVSHCISDFSPYKLKGYILKSNEEIKA